MIELWVLLICFIDKGEGLPQVKQVALQISLKCNLIECVIYCFAMIRALSIWKRSLWADENKCTQGTQGKQGALNILLIKE